MKLSALRCSPIANILADAKANHALRLRTKFEAATNAMLHNMICRQSWQAVLIVITITEQAISTLELKPKLASV